MGKRSLGLAIVPRDGTGVQDPEDEERVVAGRQGDKQLGNTAVSSPFEPGSVNKIITASSVIEYGLSNPAEVLQVPGSINMGGVTVNDAWNHGVMPYTNYLSDESTLSPRHRELLILRVAWLCANPSMWATHAARARSAGPQPLPLAT